MTKHQFSEANTLARSNATINPEQEPIDIFDGFALPDYAPVYVTIKQIARLIRYQAIYMNGGIDSDNLQEIANCGRRKFMVI